LPKGTQSGKSDCRNQENDGGKADLIGGPFQSCTDSRQIMAEPWNLRQILPEFIVLLGGFSV
jgi:hypothetical protein